MKKILTIVLLAFAVNTNAFWSSSNMPWNNGVSNYNYNNYNNQGYSYQQDNGLFTYNPYDYWDPRWYIEEMSDMFDEFGGNSWDNSNYNKTGYGYNSRDYALENTATGDASSQQQEFLRQKL